MIRTLDTTLAEPGDSTGASRGRGDFLFLVLECERPLAGALRLSLQGITSVTVGRGPERSLSRSADALEVRVPDSFLSGAHARLVRDGDQWVLEDGPSRNGCFVGGRRVSRVPLRDRDLIELGHSLFVLREGLSTSGKGDRKGEDNGAGEDADSTRLDGDPGLHTLLPELAQSFAALARVAPSDVPVLLLGETGTGKEVVARALHRLSLRGGAFVAVNCGALPETLIESQLFGHQKGSFSGALRDEPGFVRAADHGMLFLDEIGDLAKTAQAALLRVLQEREVVPVGGTRPIHVDLRIVCATHRPLEAMVASGDFRADLYARISGCIQVLPPLRERREDLGVLIGALLRSLAGDQTPKTTLSIEVGRALLRHQWPLNVRELRQCLNLAGVLAGKGPLRIDHLPLSVTAPASARAAPAEGPETSALDDEEIRSKLEALLQQHHGNVSEVARAMGKARMQIHRWMKRFGIDPRAHRSP